MQEFTQYLFSGLTNGAVYAIIAIGLSMLYSSTGLINFAHGEFVMMGALCMVTLWGVLKLPLVAAFAITIAVVSTAGIIFERLAIRSARKPTPVSLIIITVGASIFFRGLAMLIWGKEQFSVNPFLSMPPMDIFGAKLLSQSVLIIIAIIILSISLWLFFGRTLTGKAMIASAVSKKAACLSGIPYERMIMLSFAISATCGAVAGVFIAPITMSSYDMGTLLGLKGFCAAMAGGLGSLPGAALGGLILGILEAMSAGYISSGMKDAAAFFLLLSILYIRPGGLFAAVKADRF